MKADTDSGSTPISVGGTDFGSNKTLFDRLRPLYTGERFMNAMERNDLDLFREGLEAECDEFVSAHELENTGQGLIWWYFSELHDMQPADIEAVMCDGSGDLGIDSIYIDESNIVHFYQFKRIKSDKGFPTGEIDKLLSGLRMIINRGYRTIGNPELITRIDDMLRKIRAAYRVHLVSSGTGVESDGREKLDREMRDLSSLFSWVDEPLIYLHQTFYKKNIPGSDEPITFLLDTPPYSVQSGIAESHFFSATGTELASLYDRYGESLLQRNIRVDQGPTATNKSLEAACSGVESGNFIHYNN